MSVIDRRRSAPRSTRRSTLSIASTVRRVDTALIQKVPMTTMTRTVIRRSASAVLRKSLKRVRNPRRVNTVSIVRGTAPASQTVRKLVVMVPARAAAAAVPRMRTLIHALARSVSTSLLLRVNEAATSHQVRRARRVSGRRRSARRRVAVRDRLRSRVPGVEVLWCGAVSSLSSPTRILPNTLFLLDE